MATERQDAGPMVPVGICLRDATYRALHDRATEHGTSFGAEARAAIERDLSGPRDIVGLSDAAEILGVRTGNCPKIVDRFLVPVYRKRSGNFYWRDEVVALAERRAAARIAA